MRYSQVILTISECPIVINMVDSISTCCNNFKTNMQSISKLMVTLEEKNFIYTLVQKIKITYSGNVREKQTCKVNLKSLTSIGCALPQIIIVSLGCICITSLVCILK